LLPNFCKTLFLFHILPLLNNTTTTTVPSERLGQNLLSKRNSVHCWLRCGYATCLCMYYAGYNVVYLMSCRA